MKRLFESLRKNTGLATGLRLTGFIGLLLVALMLVDSRLVLAHLSTVSWSAIALMTTLHIVIILLVSWRFALIARATGADIRLSEANRLTFGSTLANMVLPTSLAGDAGRIWLIRRFGLTLRAAMGVGVFDRVIGLASLGAIVLFGTLAEPSIVPLWVIGTICVMSAGIVAVVFARWKPAAASGNSSSSLPHPRGRILAAIVALSLAAHLVSIAIAYAFLNDQGVSISVAQLLVLFPAILLAASIPISVGGWGTRELAAVGAFAMINLAAPAAIAMAFMFGVTQVVAAGLGTLCFALAGPATVDDDD